MHEGNTIQRGHYIAYVKKSGRWYRTDDLRVTKVSPFEATHQQAYLLFYQKVEKRRKPKAPVIESVKRYCVFLPPKKNRLSLKKASRIEENKRNDNDPTRSMFTNSRNVCKCSKKECKATPTSGRSTEMETNDTKVQASDTKAQASSAKEVSCTKVQASKTKMPSRKKEPTTTITKEKSAEVSTQAQKLKLSPAIHALPPN